MIKITGAVDYYLPENFTGIAEYANGSKEWYQNGLLHRLDGPAIEDNGSKYWFQNDQLHRDNGPAVEYADGTKEWYKEGKCHRDNGPAIEYPNGKKSWYINGENYTEEEFNKKMNKEISIGKAKISIGKAKLIVKEEVVHSCYGFRTKIEHKTSIVDVEVLSIYNQWAFIIISNNQHAKPLVVDINDLEQ